MVLVTWGVGAEAQTTERIGRVELSNGYISVEARSDGLMLISAVSTLRFDFGSGVFSPRTVTAWADSVERIVDSVRAMPGARIGSSGRLMSADRGAGLELTFELSPMPTVAFAQFQRADGVGLTVAGTRGDSSLTALIGFLRDGAARTIALTRASPDSARLGLSDAELTGHTTPQDRVREHPPVRWGTTDRLFVIGMASGLTGLAGAYVNGKLIVCRKEPLCGWTLDNAGFTIGSVAGAALASAVFYRGGQCRLTERLVRSVGAAMIGAMPGAMLSAGVDRAGVTLVPAGQAIMADLALRKCRISG